MKFILYCDFSTLKCTKFEFAEKLNSFTSHYRNHNDYIWELEIDDVALIPYSDNDCETVYMQFSDFVDSHSILKVFRASESFGNDEP